MILGVRACASLSASRHQRDRLTERRGPALDGWALDMRYDIETKTGSGAPGGVLFQLLGVQTPEEALKRVDEDGPSPTQLLPLGVPQVLFTGSNVVTRTPP